jgi:hypothetical protein
MVRLVKLHKVAGKITAYVEALAFVAVIEFLRAGTNAD